MDKTEEACYKIRILIARRRCSLFCASTALKPKSGDSRQLGNSFGHYLLPTFGPNVPEVAAFPPKTPDVAAPNVPGLRPANALPVGVGVVDPEGVGVIDPKVPGPVVIGLDSTVVPGVTALVSPLGPTTVDVVPGGATLKGFPGLVTTV